MVRISAALLVMVASLLIATPAHARFGKSGGGSSSHSSSSSSTHGAAPVNSGGGSRSSGSTTSNGYGYTGYGYGGYGYGGLGYNPWRYGFYSGAFVPAYGYGYGYYTAYPYAYGYRSPYGYAPGLIDSGVKQEPSSLRITVGLEATPYIGSERGGFGIGGTAMFEGQRWGVSLLFQNIAAPSNDGITAYDNIQQFNAHLTFAFLTGKYGRLRVEAGLDSIFAPNLIVLAPTAGVSGTLWIGGPVALEASVMVTPWPIRQLDLRGGVVVGLGPIGLRAGWRTQVLDDQGVVDGIVNHDTFMGPYVGGEHRVLKTASSLQMPSPRLVLLRPRNADNLGAIARAMKNFGLSDWVVVSPNPLLLEAPGLNKLAVKAGDLLESVRRVDSLAEAVADCAWVVGTTMRRIDGRRRLTPRELAATATERNDEQWALVFGDERNGLDNDDLSQCHALSFIPSRDEQPSLNLAQAVMVYAYELSSADRPAGATPAPTAASDAQLRQVRESLELGLGAVGFLTQTTDARHAVDDLFESLTRARLSKKEAALWTAAMRVVAKRGKM